MSDPYMLPMEKRKDPASVRAVRAQQDRQRETQRMFGQGDDLIQTTPWTVSDADANTPGYRQWASFVPEVMDQKIISAKYVADQMGVSEEDAAKALGGAYTSMNDMIETSLRTQFSRMGVDPYDPAVDKYVQERIRDTQRVMATGSGTAQHIELAQQAMGAVQQHAPGGQYALQGGRTQEQAAEADAKYGSNYADFYLTPDGQQNHRALRAMEFLSAARKDYDPANAMSQASRLIGSAFEPAMRGIQQGLYGNARPFSSDAPGVERGSALLDPLMEFQQMNTPGGKFEYATQMLRRSAFPKEGGEYSVYDAVDRPKYYTYSMMSGPGKANAYLSASYPVGWGSNWLTNNRHLGTFIGNALEGGIEDAVDDNRAAAAIRTNQNRVSPRQVPGLTMDQSRRSGDLMRDHDWDADSYASALLGPPLSRAMGSETAYLSPFSSGAANILGDLVSDPTNIAMQAALPVGGAVMGGLKGAATRSTLIPKLASAAKGAGKGYLSGAASRAASLGDDAIEETGENAVFSLPMGGMFSGQRDNHLMNDMSASQVTFGKVRDAYTESLGQRREATEELRRQAKERRAAEATAKKPALGRRPTMTQMIPENPQYQ